MSYNSIQKEYCWIIRNLKGPLYKIRMKNLYSKVLKAINDPNISSRQKLNLLQIRDIIKEKL